MDGLQVSPLSPLFPSSTVWVCKNLSRHLTVRNTKRQQMSWNQLWTPEFIWSHDQGVWTDTLSPGLGCLTATTGRWRVHSWSRSTTKENRLVAHMLFLTFSQGMLLMYLWVSTWNHTSGKCIILNDEGHVINHRNRKELYSYKYYPSPDSVYEKRTGEWERANAHLHIVWRLAKPRTSLALSHKRIHFFHVHIVTVGTLNN